MNSIPKFEFEQKISRDEAEKLFPKRSRLDPSPPTIISAIQMLTTIFSLTIVGFLALQYFSSGDFMYVFWASLATTPLTLMLLLMLISLKRAAKADRKLDTEAVALGEKFEAWLEENYGATVANGYYYRGEFTDSKKCSRKTEIGRTLLAGQDFRLPLSIKSGYTLQSAAKLEGSGYVVTKLALKNLNESAYLEPLQSGEPSWRSNRKRDSE